MLVALPTKKVAEFWDVFKEVIRESVPTAPDMLPDRMQQALFAAMTGRLQCWLMAEREDSDSFYGACVTRTSIDDLSGQKSLLIYALANFRPCPPDVRRADFATMKKIAAEWGCSHITAYVDSETVAEMVKRANGGNVSLTYYLRIPTGEDE